MRIDKAHGLNPCGGFTRSMLRSLTQSGKLTHITPTFHNGCPQHQAVHLVLLRVQRRKRGPQPQAHETDLPATRTATQPRHRVVHIRLPCGQS